MKDLAILSFVAAAICGITYDTIYKLHQTSLFANDHLVGIWYEKDYPLTFMIVKSTVFFLMIFFVLLSVYIQFFRKK